MRRRTFLAGLGFAALQLAGCAAKPQTTPDYVLTYADNQPAGYPTTQGAQYFADLVQQQTGGKVVIQVKANGECGSEQQVWEQLAIGGVDFARVSLSVATDDLPRLNVLLLPYLYRDADHMWRVLDGSIGADFLQDFTAQGRVGLSWYDAGARSFYARQPVRSLNDLQGKTIRVQDSQIVIDMIRLLGAVPETTAYSDVYSALETGQIDAAENNWPAYYSMEHYKVARYYMADEHSRVPEVQLASVRTWDALPEEYQQILQKCARASAQYERQLWAQEETAAREAALAGGCRELPLPEEAAPAKTPGQFWKFSIRSRSRPPSLSARRTPTKNICPLWRTSRRRGIRSRCTARRINTPKFMRAPTHSGRTSERCARRWSRMWMWRPSTGCVSPAAAQTQSATATAETAS